MPAAALRKQQELIEATVQTVKPVLELVVSIQQPLEAAGEELAGQDDMEAFMSRYGIDKAFA